MLRNDKTFWSYKNIPIITLGYHVCRLFGENAWISFWFAKNKPAVGEELLVLQRFYTCLSNCLSNCAPFF